MVVKQTPSQTNRQDDWLYQVAIVTKELHISAILVSGKTADYVVEFCSSQQVVIISDVHGKVLQAVAEATEAQIATYVEECTQVCVSKDISSNPQMKYNK